MGYLHGSSYSQVSSLAIRAVMKTEDEIKKHIIKYRRMLKANAPLVYKDFVALKKYKASKEV